MVVTTRLRVSVVALFVNQGEVLLLHQMTPPEPDCWDLPGEGLEPSEDLSSGLRREVREEIGVTNFQIERLLTVAEAFYIEEENQKLHKLDIIYQCRADPKPTHFETLDEQEIGPRGIRWIPIADLTPECCSSRVWKALQAANWVAVKADSSQ
ncbi:MAG: NUDIX domain-containing protein [Leptolyngbya sp. SIO1D8]|nr:NUDIX domain-containing protein [Leptolyngbya sp. SIO1D8]